MCKINPKVDIAFKKLFGSEGNKDLLLSFINSVLPQTEQIIELTLQNPYNLSDYISGKLSILDIKATDENGKLYDIEMQVGRQGYYGKRALYYWGKAYTNQIDSGELFSKLKKTVVISILDFDFFEERNDGKYHRSIAIKDQDTNEVYTELDYFELHFIELKKFKKELSAITTTLDRWIIFLTKSYEYEKNSIPKELAEDAQIKKAIEELDVIYMNKKEQEIYEGERKAIWNYKEELRTAQEEAREKGLEEGMKEGKEEGMKEGIEKSNLKTAKIAKGEGISISLISKMTGLSKEEVEKL